MRKKHYKAEAPGGGPPRLVQVIQQLGALKKEGLTDPRREDELKELEKDRGEVILAILWVWEGQRLRRAIESRAKRAEAIDEAAKRTDLTWLEWRRLYAAICEDLHELKKTVQRE